MPASAVIFNAFLILISKLSYSTTYHLPEILLIIAERKVSQIHQIENKFINFMAKLEIYGLLYAIKKYLCHLPISENLCEKKVVFRVENIYVFFFCN